MKWKAKDKPLTPNLGLKREVKKLALFFPRKVQGYWLWFEKYISIQEYSKLYIFYRKVSVPNGWYEVDRRLVPHPKDPFAKPFIE